MSVDNGVKTASAALEPVIEKMAISDKIQLVLEK